MGLYCTDPAQHRTTAGYDLDDLDRGLSDLPDVWKSLCFIFYFVVTRIYLRRRCVSRSTAMSISDSKWFASRADPRFPLHALDLPGKADIVPILYDLQ